MKAEQIAESVDRAFNIALLAGAVAMSLMAVILLIGTFAEHRRKVRIVSRDPEYTNPRGFGMPKPKIAGTVLLMVIALIGACVAVWLWLPYIGINPVEVIKM